jgi:hypothetical protein
MRGSGSLRATLLLLVVLILTCWNGARLWAAAAWYDVLLEFAPRPGPVYTALSGAFWLAAGLAVTWGLWRRKAWAAKALIGAAAGYTSWYWLDRILFQSPRANWPFVLLVNLFLLAYVLTSAIPHVSLNHHRERGS